MSVNSIKNPRVLLVAIAIYEQVSVCIHFSGPLLFNHTRNPFFFFMPLAIHFSFCVSNFLEIQTSAFANAARGHSIMEYHRPYFTACISDSFNRDSQERLKYCHLYFPHSSSVGSSGFTVTSSFSSGNPPGPSSSSGATHSACTALGAGGW